MLVGGVLGRPGTGGTAGQSLVFAITRGFPLAIRSIASGVTPDQGKEDLRIQGIDYPKDMMTNVTPKILSHIGRELHLQAGHPLNLIKQRITNYIYKRYPGHRGVPAFSLHENLSPVVTLNQNFDSLLVPKGHVSRTKSDSYYVNSSYMLRAHTSAHQADLVASGLDEFLVTGDVYRRDEIDRSHYPVFHQMEGVRLLSQTQIQDL